jgi:multidrug efflux pump subunit AcrB
VVLLLLIPVGVGAFLLFTHLQTGFFPEFDEGGFILDYQLPDGTSLAQSSAVAQGIEGILAKTPEVAAWSRRTGAQLGFDITTQNVGDMSVRLRDSRSRDINAVMDDVRAKVQSAYPAAQVDFHQVLQDNIGDIAGSPSAVDVKIFGTDSATLENLATQVDGIVAGTHGVVDDFDGIINSSPETVLRVNTERAQRYGLTTDDITQAASAAVAGVEPTSVQVGEQSIGVRVVLDLSGALDPSALSEIPIASPVTGGDVPLGQVADLVPTPGTLQVTRENQRQVIDVTAGLSGTDLGTATRAIQKSIAAKVHLPPGYSIEYGGLYASQQRSFGELGAVLVVALLFVFTLLVVQFRSVRQAAALIVAAILSLSGVMLALSVTGTPLNISSFTGAIMIVGIITENGIVLFDFFNHLRRESPDADLTKVMAEAGAQRLRPILMTTIAAILALLPLALGLGAGAALQKPLAIAVIGGLSVSVLFTLLVAPVLYVTLDGLYARRPVREEQGESDANAHELPENYPPSPNPGGVRDADLAASGPPKIGG